MQNSGWIYSQCGGPEVLSLAELPMPSAGVGQLLIRVLAAGFNPVDTKIRAGLAPIPSDNRVTGCDVCGEVIAVGDGVTGFSVGDRVYGCAGGVKGNGGTLCQFMVVDASLVAVAPVSVTPEQAAVLPLISITAFEAFERLSLSDGDACLILGGSGGVGQMAVQFARLRGADVTATAGSVERVEHIRALGAQAILHEQATDQPGKFAKVLDTHGGASFQAALVAAAPWGQVATINARNTYDLTQAHGKALSIHAIFMLLPLLTGVGREKHGHFLSWLAGEVDVGRVVVPDVEIVAAGAVAEVHGRYESGALKTKVAFRL